MYIYASNGIKTIVMLPDSEPLHPRRDWDNPGTMVCWHSRHDLGDPHDYKDPQAFAIDMVLKNMSQKDVLAAIKNGDLVEFRMSPSEKEGEYTVEGLIGLIPGKERWEQMEWKVSESLEVIESEDASFDLQEDILDWCSTPYLLSMVEKQGNVAILPLFLYDHSGLSMSTGSFVGRAPHARWDSGQVGFIYMDKATAMESLCLTADTIHVARNVPYPEAVRLNRMAGKPEETIDDILTRNGYAPVKAEHILNMDAVDPDKPEKPILEASWANDGLLYKKGSRLYLYEGESQDASLSMLPVATFNPGLKRLTEDMWKTRAEEALESEVKAYDNYLTGDVYVVETYDGTVLEDSEGGYYPSEEGIEADIASEYSRWFEGPMHFETDYNSSFDIYDFFENHEFPELREKYRKDVADFITFEAQTSKVYPFGVPAEQLLSEGNPTMESIVDDLYAEHEEYDSDHLFEVIASYAGYSREVEPKVTAQDFEPGRDYTASEVMEVLNKKPSLKDMIKNAAAKRDAQREGDKGQEPVR